MVTLHGLAKGNRSAKVNRSANANRTADAVDRNTLQWLLVAQGVVVFPLFFYLPMWLPVLWVGVVVSRVQMFRGAWPFPKGSVKTAVGIVAIIALGVTYRGRIGVDSMVAFLVIAFVLKLIEIRDKKGVVQLVYIGFIGVAALFIFSQAVWAAAYSLCSVMLLFGCLQSLYRRKRLSYKAELTQALLLLLKSLPVMAVLFVVIPRVGPLWAVPNAGASGKTGFSDTMSPGDLSHLARSSEIAFRVSFDANPQTGTVLIPPQEELYWRGIVLDIFDGRSWIHTSPWNRLGASVRRASAPHPEWGLQEPEQKSKQKSKQGSTTYSYTVLLEPHRQPWLFTLLTPTRVTSRARLLFTNDYLLFAAKDIRYRMAYQVESNTGYLRRPALSSIDRNENTYVPEGNRKSRALAQEWLQQGLTPKSVVAKALAMVNASFSYSLDPPALGRDSVDEFLFETKTGFCEHFASAFVFLMRAAKVPARVVVGYQGGEVSEDGSHLTVRQSDAHAWAEVWYNDEGWVRVDPTSAVAPNRTTLGISNALSARDARLIKRGFIGMAWTQALQLQWEELEYLWQRNILAYDDSRQSDFLKRLLGSDTPWRIALFFVAVIGALLGLYQLLPVLARRRAKVPREEILYLRYLQRMSKKGYPRNPWETAAAYAERIMREAPELGPHAASVAHLYNCIMYGRMHALVPQFEAAINQI